MIKKRITFLSMLLLVALSAIAQVKTSVSYKKVSATELDIVFTFQLESGWHLYGAHKRKTPIRTV